MLYTIDDLASALKVSRRTLYRWIRSDADFPKPLGVGAGTRFLAEEVDRWIRTRQRGLSAPPCRKKAA